MSKTTKYKMQVSQADIAKKSIQSINALFKKMGLDPKATTQHKRVLLGTAHVPSQFIQQVAATADQHGSLIGITFDSDSARQALEYAATFEPVAAMAETFAASVRDTILAARAEAGSASLAAYAAMKGVVRRPEGAVIRGELATMTEIMKRARKGHPTAPVVAPAAPAAAPSPGTAVQPPLAKAA